MFEVVFDYGDHDRDAPTPRDDELTKADGTPQFPWDSARIPFRRTGRDSKFVPRGSAGVS
jgi:hypothetical protein